MPETSCITEVQDKTFTFQNSHFTVDNIFNLVTSFTTKLSVHAKAIPRLRITNWTHADALFDFQFVTTSLTCSVTPIAAVRPAIADQWYINIAFTNPKRVMHVPRDHRKTIMEYVTADDNNAFKKPLAMQLPKEANATGLLGNGTTLLVSSRGEAVASYVGQTYPEENEAVIESMGKADIFIQQVTDALSPSGVAILILPLGVALVPIALLADVSTVFMLIYTLMTDVLIVIPLGIKGLELIGIGNNRFRTISVRMSGFMSGEDSETAGAELFAAECRAKDYVRPIGVLFVCLSLVFMTLGIIAEMVALRFVNSRRRRKKTWLKEEIKKICLNGEGCQGLRCTGCTLGTRFRRSHIPK